MIEQTRLRAANPETRTDVPPPGETSHLGGRFRTVVASLGGSDSTAGELPAPVDADRIAVVESRLGVGLPGDLVEVLVGVADGGFGPGAGLASLEEMTSRYLDMVEGSPDRYGRPWPADLFPIDLEPPGADCIDLESGRIVYWDAELASERPGDNGWTESFRVVAESLEAWLQAWLESPAPRGRICGGDGRDAARRPQDVAGVLEGHDARGACRVRTAGGRVGTGAVRSPRSRPSTSCERRRPPDGSDGLQIGCCVRFMRLWPVGVAAWTVPVAWKPVLGGHGPEPAVDTAVTGLPARIDVDT